MARNRRGKITKTGEKTRDPMARDLFTPKYRPQVVQRKDKTLPRKAKHKGKEE